MSYVPHIVLFVINNGDNDFFFGQDYLSAALDYLRDTKSSGHMPAKDIKAVWVASDDSQAATEVRGLVRDYFPNVVDENVRWISGGHSGSAVATRSELEVRKIEAICQTEVYLL